MYNTSRFSLFIVLFVLTLWRTDSSPSMNGPRPYHSPDSQPVCASSGQSPNPLLTMTQCSSIRPDLVDWETKQEEAKDQTKSPGLGQAAPAPSSPLPMISMSSSSLPKVPSQANLHTIVARQLAALFAALESEGEGGVADAVCKGTIVSKGELCAGN